MTVRPAQTTVVPLPRSTPRTAESVVRSVRQPVDGFERASTSFSAAHAKPASPTKEIDSARRGYDDARDDYEQRQRQLDEDMKHLPLTPEQREAYEAAYWADPKNKRVKDNYEAARTKLVETVEKYGPAIEANGTEREVEALTEAHEQLARDPATAQRALDYAGRVATSPRLCELVDADDVRDLVKTALPNAQAHALSHPEAMEALCKSLDQLAQSPEVMGELAPAFAELAALLRRPGPPDPQALLAFATKWASHGELGELLAGSAVAHGIATAPDDRPDIAQQLANGLTALDNSVSVVVVVAEILENGLEHAPRGDALRLASRFVPFLGALSSSVEFWNSCKRYADNPDGGKALRVIGDFVSAVGGWVGCIPVVGQVIGTIFTILGIAVSKIGNVVSDQIQQARREQLLIESGIDPVLAKRMAENPDAVAGLRKAGLTDEQIQYLLTNYPDQAIAFGEVLSELSPEQATALVSEMRKVATETSVPFGELMCIAVENGSWALAGIFGSSNFDPRGYAEQLFARWSKAKAEASQG